MEYDQLVYSLKYDHLDTRKYVPDKFAKYAMLRAIPQIGGILVDPNEPGVLRIECAESLGKLGSVTGVSFLTQVMSDNNEELRRTSIWALGQIATPDILPILINALGDPSFKVKRWTIKSLKEIRHHSIGDIFDKLLEDKSITCDSILLTEVFRVLKIHFSQVNLKEKWLELASNALASADTNLLASSLSLLKLYEASDFVSQISDQILQLIDRNEKSSPIMGDLVFFLNRFGRLDELTKMLNELGSNDPLGYIVNLLESFVDSIDILLNLLGSPYEVVVLGALQVISKCEDIHKINIELNNFFKHTSMSIQQAALHIHCAKGGDFQILMNYYQKGKGLGLILKLFYYYPEEGLDILIKNAIEGKKTNRISSVHTLLKMLDKSRGLMREEIIKVLKLVSKKDRVWHLRRLARMGLMSQEL